MKSFNEFLIERRENFMDVAHTSLETARLYFAAALDGMGYSIDKDFPDFDKGYTLAKTKISAGKYNRNQMPVVKSDDLEKFIEFMAESGIKVKREKEKSINLIPIQKQLYLDNPIRNIKLHGLQEVINFLKNKSHAIISRDNYVLDGNHRLLMAWLYDRDMMLSVNRVDLNVDDLFNEMNTFTDKITRRKRNEAVE
jgi:hypothetical protein